MKTKILTLLFSLAAMVLATGCSNDSGGGGSLPGPQEFARDYEDSALKLTLNNTLQGSGSQIVTLAATSENTVSLTLYNVFNGIPSITMTGIGYEAFEKNTGYYCKLNGHYDDFDQTKQGWNITGTIEKGTLFLTLKSTALPEDNSWMENPIDFKKADKITVKVALVIEDPASPQLNGKRLHEHFGWNDPVQLAEKYEAALELASGGVVDYVIVERIDADTLWTSLGQNPNAIPLPTEEMVGYLKEPGWATLKENNTKYNYKAMIEYYEFDKKRNRDEVDEVWVFSWPYGGMWESTQAGTGSGWCNSSPVEGVSCNKILTVMGLNFERDLNCAMESYGHRTESIIKRVYNDKWEPNSLNPSNWDLYTRYDKICKNRAHIGNIHYPPNALKDYDFGLDTYVNSYCDIWADYPYLDLKKSPRKVNVSEWQQQWGDAHEGYMRWWFSHLPNKEGLNPKPSDQHLNNWWHYLVKYEDAMALETELRSKQ